MLRIIKKRLHKERIHYISFTLLDEMGSFWSKIASFCLSNFETVQFKGYRQDF